MSLSSRLAQARIVVDDDTRRGHLAAIDNAIVETTRRRRRGRALAVGLAVVLLVPVVALAAERSVPGDLLYPVRQLIHQTLDRSQPKDQASPAQEPLREAEDEGPSREAHDRTPVPSAREQPAEEPPAEEEETGDGGDRPEQEADTTRDPNTLPDDGGPDEGGSEPATRPTTTTFPESTRGHRQP